MSSANSTSINLDILPAMQPLTVIAGGVTYTCSFLSAPEALAWQAKFKTIAEGNEDEQIALAIDLCVAIGIPQPIAARFPAAALQKMIHDFFEAQNSIAV
jgi:hypothetical protein